MRQGSRRASRPVGRARCSRGLRRIERAAELLPLAAGRHVDLDQFQVVRTRDHVVRDAGRLREAGAGLHGDVAVDAGEPEGDPALQHDHEMAGHVMPVPAGRLLERTDRADVFGADLAARRRCEPEVAVFVVGARAVTHEGFFRLHHVIEPGVRVREIERARVAHRLVGGVHDVSYPGTHASARVSVRRRGSAVQLSPPSCERKYWPSAVAAKISCGSAGLVATHQVELSSLPGSPASSQRAPWSRLRMSLPQDPGGPSPLHNSTKPLPSARGTIPRVYWFAESMVFSAHESPSFWLTCSP